MSLSHIPLELLQEILAFALYGHPSPSKILCVNKTFLELGEPILHAHLHFSSIDKLINFAQNDKPLSCAPRSLIIALAGGSADFEVFKHLAGALQRCRRLSRSPRRSTDSDIGIHSGLDISDCLRQRVEDLGAGQVALEVLHLRLHSHSGNTPLLSDIYEALAHANPKSFIWRGPNPEYHFSTAIVPTATYHLIRAIGTWTAVEHITLTNMSFPSDELGRNTPFAHDAPLLPPLPALRTLYIGQAALLPPSAVAAMVAHGDGALERVRLVDAYRHNIWGPRIRLKDVEDAACALRNVTEERRAVVVERVRRIVRCEKKTEGSNGRDDSDEEGELAYAGAA